MSEDYLLPEHVRAEKERLMDLMGEALKRKLEEGTPFEAEQNQIVIESEISFLEEDDRDPLEDDEFEDEFEAWVIRIRGAAAGEFIAHGTVTPYIYVGDIVPLMDEPDITTLEMGDVARIVEVSETRWPGAIAREKVV